MYNTVREIERVIQIIYVNGYVFTKACVGGASSSDNVVVLPKSNSNSSCCHNGRVSAAELSQTPLLQSDVMKTEDVNKVFPKGSRVFFSFVYVPSRVYFWYSVCSISCTLLVLRVNDID